jgi:hypothetical protein
LEKGDNGSRPVAYEHPGDVSDYTLYPDTQQQHEYVIHRPPFDDLSIKVMWDDDHWNRETAHGDVAMDDQTRFDLSRSVRLRVFPGHVTVRTESGEPLPQHDGLVVIPSAWSPPPLYVDAPLFLSYRLEIPKGDLDNPKDTGYPKQTIKLQPRFGVFSYWQFYVILLAVGVASRVSGRVRLWWVLRRPAPGPVDAAEAEIKPVPRKATAAEPEKSVTTTFVRFLKKLSGPAESETPRDASPAEGSPAEPAGGSVTSTWDRLLRQWGSGKKSPTTGSLKEPEPAKATATETVPMDALKGPEPAAAATDTLPVSSWFMSHSETASDTTGMLSWEPLPAMPLPAPPVHAPTSPKTDILPVSWAEAEATPTPAAPQADPASPRTTAISVESGTMRSEAVPQSPRTERMAPRTPGRRVPPRREVLNARADWLMQTPMTGQSGRKFDLQFELGRGPLAITFEASVQKARDNARVAIKVLMGGQWQEAEALERLAREVRSWSALTHPTIIRVIDWGTARSHEGINHPYIVVERLAGQTLRELLEGYRNTAIPTPHALSWTLELLRAMEKAHKRGVIHRNLKPENVMALKDGHLKVMDFGVGGPVATPLTLRGTPLATLMYMAPEVYAANNASPAADVYSLGVMLYEALAGWAPYEHPDVESLAESMALGNCVPLSSANPLLPAELCTVVMDMMAAPITRRFATALEAREALSEIAAFIAPELFPKT